MTAATCSFRSAASASPLPFAARIFATTVSTSAIALPSSPPACRRHLPVLTPSGRGGGGAASCECSGLMAARSGPDPASVHRMVRADELEKRRPALGVLVEGPPQG